MLISWAWGAPKARSELAQTKDSQSSDVPFVELSGFLLTKNSPGIESQPIIGSGHGVLHFAEGVGSNA